MTFFNIIHYFFFEQTLKDKVFMMIEMTARELQLFCLDILKDVHSFCVKNNIGYSLAYGSLLGAVRHRGFIPWDNDVDIYMLRSDYERFVNSYKSDKYEIAFFGEKSKYDCLIAYARVFDVKRSVAKNSNWVNADAGVWIDVFPVDVVPPNKRDFEVLYQRYYNYWKRIQKKRVQFYHLSNAESLTKMVRLLVHKMVSINGFRGHAMQENYIKCIRREAESGNEFVSQLAVMDNGPVEHFPASLFSNLCLLEFEGCSFFSLADYKQVLGAIYGDYMKMPPPEKRIPHQSYIKFYWRQNEK